MRGRLWEVEGKDVCTGERVTCSWLTPKALTRLNSTATAITSFNRENRVGLARTLINHLTVQHRSFRHVFDEEVFLGIDATLSKLDEEEIKPYVRWLLIGAGMIDRV